MVKLLSNFKSGLLVQLDVNRFNPNDLQQLKIQSNQTHFYDYLNMDYSGLTGYTISKDGVILCCAGLQRIYPHRYAAWSVWSELANKYMLTIVRLIKQNLSTMVNCRIECNCDYEFSNAHQLVKMLGFKCEAPLLRRYEIDGRDSSLYSLIKE